MCSALIAVVRNQHESERKLALHCRACLVDARQRHVGIYTPHGHRCERGWVCRRKRRVDGIGDDKLLCLQAVISEGLFKHGRWTPVVEDAAADADDRAVIPASHRRLRTWLAQLAK
jgi:hypothetical protein